MPAKKTTRTTKRATKTTTTAKRAVKSTTAKAAVAPKKKLTAVKTPMTKTQILTEIAEGTELTRKQVAAVFDNLSDMIERHVKPRAAGKFTMPGLMKIEAVKKPAKKARKGINPFTGEETMFKAKPAHTVVKVKALKALKEMVG